MSHKGSDFSGKIKYFDKLLLISFPLPVVRELCEVEGAAFLLIKYLTAKGRRV